MLMNGNRQEEIIYHKNVNRKNLRVVQTQKNRVIHLELRFERVWLSIFTCNPEFCYQNRIHLNKNPIN